MFHSMTENFTGTLPNLARFPKPAIPALAAPANRAQKADPPIEHPFRLAKAVWAHGRDTVRLHPEDLARLEALDGDTFYLCGGAEPIPITVTPSRTVPKGRLMVCESVRRRLKVGRLGRVTLQTPGGFGS